MRSFWRRYSKFLPKWLRYRILRQAIIIDYAPLPQDIVFKIAETQEELEGAYRLLHDSYVDCGFQQPDPTGLRIIKYFALPTTTTLIAKKGEQVIGTISIIRDSIFGLPMETAFDLSEMRKGKRTVAEVSSLAIAKNYRHRRGALFLPLCKYSYHYVKTYMSAERVVITVNPEWADFYEGYFDFKQLSKTAVSQYKFANGAPAVGLWSDVTNWKSRLQNIYGHRAMANSLVNYVWNHPCENFRFPNRAFETAMDPVMSPAMLDYFFRQRSDVFKQLTEREILSLKGQYPEKSFHFVLPRPSGRDHRQATRFAVGTEALLNSRSWVKLVDVSKTGLLLRAADLPITNHLLVPVGRKKQMARLRAIVRWQNHRDGTVGLEIIESDSAWFNYVACLEESFNYLKPA